MEIHITDNAGGVPPDTIDRMLNPFVAARPPERGTALGLGLSNNVMCRHGGGIREGPEPGEFIDMIVMPRTESPSEAGGDGITDMRDNGREHIT